MNELIVKKLNNLKKVRPSASWLVSQRSFLLSEITRIEEKEGKPSLVFPFFNFSKIFKPAFALVFAVIILISSLGTIGIISAAQNSLPGDPLYVFKTAFEQAQMTFAPGEENKAKLSIKFTDQRMEEFTQAVANPEKKQDIQKTVQRLTDQLVAVQDSMDRLKTKNAEKASEVAKIVNSQVAAYKEELTKTSEQLASMLPGDNEIKQDINQVLAELDKTTEKAGTLIKDNSGPNETDNNTLVPIKEETIDSESIPFEKISE